MFATGAQEATTREGLALWRAQTTNEIEGCSINDDDEAAMQLAALDVVQQAFEKRLAELTTENHSGDAEHPDGFETTTTWGSEPWGGWNDPTTMNWQTVSAGGWSQDDWYGRPSYGPRYKLGGLPVETRQQTVERREKERNELRDETKAEVQLAVSQSGYDEFGRVDYDKLCKLRNDLEICEKLEGLSKEELAHAKQELRAREQALEQEVRDREADMERRRAAYLADMARCVALQLKGDEADTPEEHRVEPTAAAKGPSREAIA